MSVTHPWKPTVFFARDLSCPVSNPKNAAGSKKKCSQANVLQSWSANYGGWQTQFNCLIRFSWRKQLQVWNWCKFIKTQAQKGCKKRIVVHTCKQIKRTQTKIPGKTSHYNESTPDLQMALLAEKFNGETHRWTDDSWTESSWEKLQ